MNKIETKVLNCYALKEAEINMVFTARLTQRGHTIHSMDDLLKLYNQSFSGNTVKNLSRLPHPTIQKFTVITVAVVGASRRFLTQITRHQNEVKFMSTSLQYSNYSGNGDFVIPYEILASSPEIQQLYIKNCRANLECYDRLCEAGIGHDTAGYATPHSLRNVLIISATPFQWKHMIAQRTCRRNTDEMRIVMLQIWNDLYKLNPLLFPPEQTGPYCQRDNCPERSMSCRHPVDPGLSPKEILYRDYPLLKGGIKDHED